MGLADLCTEIVTRGQVRADDVLALRRAVFGEIAVTREEVEALFLVDEGTERRAPEWRAFFLEAVTDWLVRQQDPAGYITDAQADWLVARIEADRRVRDRTELELVVRALELADQAPASLAAFGLSLVTRSVVDNDGVITADEVERMRRLVFALAGPGRMAVTRDEAAALFDLNDATRGRNNDPSWTDFFKRAVANAVTAAAGWAPPGRDEALRRQAWLEAPENDPGGLVGEALAAIGGMTPDRIRDALFGNDHAHYDEHLDRQDRAAGGAAPVDREEAAWLLDRIGRDGEFDVNERALIAFLQEIAPTTDPALKPLIDRLAA